MKISSQLANNFDYSSAEIEMVFDKISLLFVLSVSAVNQMVKTQAGWAVFGSSLTKVSSTMPAM
jgi:hypothetical protein